MPKRKRDADIRDAGADSATATPDRGSGSKKTKSGEENGTTSKKSAKAKEKIPLLTKESFSNESFTPSGKAWNMKIASWNINGIRAWVEKDGHTYLTSEDPDILCVQETKCNEEQVPDVCKIDGYHLYWGTADEAGYSGTGLFSKVKPLHVTFGLGIDKHDKEGRVITAEYQKFYLVTSYVPNSGRGLPRLPYRTNEWDVDFREYLQKLDAKKPVILCGDLNVAHQAIDLANPKTNKKTAGFTVQERDSFGVLLKQNNLFDSFRHLYPEQEKAYTFWTYMANARAKDIGWRLDYFVLSERLKEHLCDSVIRSHVMGSDHCPIALLLNI